MIRTKYGVSPWLHELPRTRRLDLPRLRDPLRVPVAVIGGGLTGCCTAYALASAGVKVALVEADRLGQAGSARGPGVVQGEAAASYREMEDRHGRRAARAMFEASRRAVLDLSATVRRLGIKPALDAGPALRVATPYGADARGLAREAALRRQAGLHAVWLPAAAAARESGMERVAGAVRLRDWAQADPYRLVLGFAAAALARGAVVAERSPVTRIKVRRKDVELHVNGVAVTADTVIVCTGEPTDLFRPLKRHVRYEERYVAQTDKLPSAVGRALGGVPRLVSDTDSPPHNVCFTSGDRLVIAGADQPRTPVRGREKVLVQRTGQLMYELLRLYPAISGVMPAYGWDLPVCSAADGAMYAGPHRNYPRHLFAWATRHDPAQAFLASRILLRHVLGTSAREDAYFAFTRG